MPMHEDLDMGEQAGEGRETSGMSGAMRKHMLKHNIMGLVNGGIDLGEAIDMAYDLNEPLFSQRLKMKRKTVIGSGGPGRGGGITGPGGGHEGGTGGG